MALSDTPLVLANIVVLSGAGAMLYAGVGLLERFVLAWQPVDELLTAALTDEGSSTGSGVMNQSEWTGADALMAGLRDAEAKIIFGIPAGQTLAIYEALRLVDDIRHILPRHEQGAAFMADGYARATGLTGVALVVGGPGTTNAMTGLGEAYADSSPVLLLSGDVNTELAGRERGVIHELRNHIDMTRSVTIGSRKAERPAEVYTFITEAFNKHRTARPRPFHVAIPENVLTLREPIDVEGPVKTDFPRPELDPGDLARAIHAIERGARPLIWAGAGVNRSGASAQLALFANVLQAPVITTALGKGSISEDNALYIGSLSLGSPWIADGPVAKLIAAADPLIVLGGRLSAASTRDWTMPSPVSLVHIDIDSQEFGKNYTADCSLRADVLEALAVFGRELNTIREPWCSDDDLQAARDQIEIHAQVGMGDAFSILRAINEVVGTEAILTGDSLIGLWAASVWRSTELRSYHFPMHFNTLGFALPAAVGASVGIKERPVIAIAGDGAALYSIAEFSTAVDNSLGIPFVVFNDQGYGSIRAQQYAAFGETYQTELPDTDFASLGRAFGGKGYAPASVEDLRIAVEETVSGDVPAVIEVASTVGAPWHTQEKG